MLVGGGTYRTLRSGQTKATEDWHVLGPEGSIRSLTSNFVPPDPYKDGQRSPLRDLTGGDNPKTIKIDIAHTHSIAGYGKDDLASSIVFLAVRCNVWGEGNYEKQLELAWDAFKAWCVENSRSTTIMEFSKKELKITSSLDTLLAMLLNPHQNILFVGCIGLHVILTHAIPKRTKAANFSTWSWKRK